MATHRAFTTVRAEEQRSKSRPDQLPGGEVEKIVVPDRVHAIAGLDCKQQLSIIKDSTADMGNPIVEVQPYLDC